MREPNSSDLLQLRESLCAERGGLVSGRFSFGRKGERGTVVIRECRRMQAVLAIEALAVDALRKEGQL